MASSGSGGSNLMPHCCHVDQAMQASISSSPTLIITSTAVGGNVCPRSFAPVEEISSTRTEKEPSSVHIEAASKTRFLVARRRPHNNSILLPETLGITPTP